MGSASKRDKEKARWLHQNNSSPTSKCSINPWPHWNIKSCTSPTSIHMISKRRKRKTNNYAPHSHKSKKKGRRVNIMQKNLLQQREWRENNHTCRPWKRRRIYQVYSLKPHVTINKIKRRNKIKLETTQKANSLPLPGLLLSLSRILQLSISLLLFLSLSSLQNPNVLTYIPLSLQIFFVYIFYFKISFSWLL